jgi:RNA polymerase sigma-70 factor (ECF subfamily)
MASPFATTHWSLVLDAGRSGSASSEAALEKLCRTYWAPLYAYVRRHGHNQEDAQDLTQSFFERLLSESRFRLADPARGRFRTFLLSGLKHFLVNEWKRGQRLKRGAGAVHLSFNCDPEEALFSREPVESVTPETLFERRWALRLLEEAMEGVRKDYLRSNQGPLFEALRGCAWGDPDGARYLDAAGKLGLSEGAFKVAVFRLRQRFRERLREVVASTLPDPQNRYDIDDEIRHLQEVLRQSRSSSAGHH